MNPQLSVAEYNSYEQIDEMMKPLIRELNGAGVETWCCCQGKTCVEDFELDRHADHAFISFGDGVVWKRRKRIRELGLVRYNGNYSITGLSGDEKTWDEVIAKNLAFPDKIRELFDLPKPPPV